MKTLHYELRFVCPAFLGDADQTARWRTPPIKALLRQWWRVVYAADHGHVLKADEMRRAEAALFGAAGERKGETGRSLVRLRLDRWAEGSLKAGAWESLPTVYHDEVQRQVAADLYLGYGPVTLPKGQPPTLKGKAAIQAGESAQLSIGLLADKAAADEPARIERALALMHRYGTLGGRSRNGWGSFELLPRGGTPDWPAAPDSTVLRPWRDALELDWAHAIGSDAHGPLVWRSAAHKDWSAAMVALAKLKIGLRVALGFRSGKNAPGPEPRHWLAHPVTNHNVRDWGESRLPNTLRFKLRRSGEKVEGVVFHMPALPPAGFDPGRYRSDILALWEGVHTRLDHQLQAADGRAPTR